ncbi:hypothetical protein HRbin02_00608 [Candidatus Calditenuaceae archaeon HR02]|nr:hypothetical protein HRbin02_00608 [Candidatus Calditenuaceae archaeon HR02]
MALPNTLNKSAMKTDDTATKRKKRNRATTEANSLGCTIDRRIVGGCRYINGFHHVMSSMRCWRAPLFEIFPYMLGWLSLTDMHG